MREGEGGQGWCRGSGGHGELRAEGGDLRYEASWHLKPIEANVWVEKDILLKMGYKKLVEREDERQAALAGLQTKFLTQPGVEKHLGDCGVDPRVCQPHADQPAERSMKVNVVLTVVMWQDPRVLILDEPTTTWTARVSVPWSWPSRTTRVA